MRTVKVTHEVDIEDIDYTFCLGDVIPFRLNTGEEVEAMAVKDEDDGMIFCLLDCLKQPEAMNKNKRNIGGYQNSDLRVKLNQEILNTFPKNIRDMMVPFENGDYLRIPTAHEILGQGLSSGISGSWNDKLEQWEPMKDLRNKLAKNGKNGNYWQPYWVQNIYVYNDSHFVIIDNAATADYCWSNLPQAVRPVFKLLKGSK